MNINSLKSLISISTHFTRNCSVFKNIIVSSVGKNKSIGKIQLNRPKALNALCKDLMDEVSVALKAFDSNSSIKCIYLIGNEKAFAAGADIREMCGKSYSEVYMKDMLGSWDDISKIKKPVIASVSGYALGGGCELAMMCDMIIASENAMFGQPEIKIGTIPGAGGTQRLTRNVGKSLAMEMVLTGEPINALQAKESGLVSKVVPNDKLEEETIKIGEKISQMSLIALKSAKEAVNSALEVGLQNGLLLEKRLFFATFATKDNEEGMRAFLEKRAAKFSDS